MATITALTIISVFSVNTNLKQEMQIDKIQKENEEIVYTVSNNTKTYLTNYVKDDGYLAQLTATDEENDVSADGSIDLTQEQINEIAGNIAEKVKKNILNEYVNTTSLTVEDIQYIKNIVTTEVKTQYARTVAAYESQIINSSDIEALYSKLDERLESEIQKEIALAVSEKIREMVENTPYDYIMSNSEKKEYLAKLEENIYNKILQTQKQNASSSTNIKVTDEQVTEIVNAVSKNMYKLEYGIDYATQSEINELSAGATKEVIAGIIGENGMLKAYEEEVDKLKEREKEIINLKQEALELTKKGTDENKALQESIIKEVERISKNNTEAKKEIDAVIHKYTELKPLVDDLNNADILERIDKILGADGGLDVVTSDNGSYTSNTLREMDEKITTIENSKKWNATKVDYSYAQDTGIKNVEQGLDKLESLWGNNWSSN